jgi:hypothetical protein
MLLRYAGHIDKVDRPNNYNYGKRQIMYGGSINTVDRPNNYNYGRK